MDTSLPGDKPKSTGIAWPRTIGAIPAGILLAIPFLVMILSTGLDFRLIGDEPLFHIKIIESFADAWPKIDISNYRSASTPLSYIFITAVGKVVGFEIWKLRMVSAIATFLATNIFYGISRRLKLPHPLLSSYIFLFFPYVFFFGFTLYPVAVGLFFGMWALSYYLLESPSPSDFLKGSFLAGFAVLCRQSFLVIPVGIAVSEVWREYRHGIKVPSRQVLTRLLILSIPILMLAPLVIVWGGFTPSVNRASQGGEWFLQFRPQQLNYILMVVGLYFAYMLVGSNTIRLVKDRSSFLLMIPALLPVLALYPVVFDESPGRIQHAGGIVIHGLDIIRNVIGAGAAFVLTWGMWIAGLVIVLGMWAARSKVAVNNRLIAIATTFVALMIISPYAYERYYVLLIPVLILLLHKSLHSRSLLSFWFVAQVLVTIGFSYWHIVLK